MKKAITLLATLTFLSSVTLAFSQEAEEENTITILQHFLTYIILMYLRRNMVLFII